MSGTTTKSHIGREDIKWHDGQGSTFSRLTSTGSSITMHKVGNEVDALTTYGSGDTYTEATIAEAQSKANENSQEVVILLAPGAWTITDDLTLSGHTLRIPRGTTVTVSSGKTLTIDDIDAGAYQIFSGSGTSTFGASAPVAVYASWWADFATCISDLGSTNARTVIVTENEAVAADMEVTSNITLLFLPPGKLTIASEKTVTLSGDVIAPRYQIFAGSGAVSWGTGYTIKNEYWEDGSTDEVTFNPTITNLSTHESDTTTHGATGAVVGTTNEQTLTNKTLTSPVINTSVSGTAVLDEDNMASNSATKVATQQSIKAYVDNNIGSSLRTLVFPASCFETRVDSGWAEFAQTQGTNYDYGQLNFDKDTDEKAYSPPFVMEDYDGGNITVKIGWKANATSGDVVWVVGFKGVANDEAWDDTITDHSFAADTAGDTEYDLMIASLTVDPSELASDDATVMKIYRDVSEDDLAADAQLLFIQLEYTRS